MLSSNDVFSSPQIEANEFIAEVDYPGVGRTRMTNTPVRLSGKPGQVGARAPGLGEHTGQVLRELGYSAERIEELERGGVVVRSKVSD